MGSGMHQPGSGQTYLSSDGRVTVCFLVLPEFRAGVAELCHVALEALGGLPHPQAISSSADPACEER